MKNLTSILTLSTFVVLFLLIGCSDSMQGYNDLRNQYQSSPTVVSERFSVLAQWREEVPIPNSSSTFKSEFTVICDNMTNIVYMNYRNAGSYYGYGTTGLFGEDLKPMTKQGWYDSVSGNSANNYNPTIIPTTNSNTNIVPTPTTKEPVINNNININNNNEN